MNKLIEMLKSWGPWGPAGLFLFSIVDGVGVPTPGGLDAALILLCVSAPGQASFLAALTIVGSLIGCMLLYYIARKGGDAILRPYRTRPRFAKFETWFQHYGLLTIFIPALVPIPMPLKFFMLCAGAFEVRPLAVFLTLVAARVPRYIALAYLGAQGKSIGWFKDHVWYLLGSSAALFIFLYLLIKAVELRRRHLIDSK